MVGHVHDGMKASRILRISLLLTLAYIVLLVVTGIRAHSLALLSEAGHNLSDFLALLLSWVAVFFQGRPPTSTKTFGYQRTGVLAAFINALTLVAVAFLIFYEAGRRLYHPEPVHAGVMMVVAAAGIAMNGIIAVLLYRTSRDVNIRSALVHEIGDTLSTAAVLFGGWGILLTGQTWIDPALSFGIGALILWSSFGIIRETLNILLEGTPRGMQLDEIAGRIRAIPGVLDVHDLHAWSLGSESHALSCHIQIADIPPSESEIILRRVNEQLASAFRIFHTTIQFEHAVCDVAHGCVVPVAEENAHGEGRSH
ncbi:MAG TPA: cation diffusion facilitator family transporter [Terriglobales bacterium]|nr:cation diffusion facilitator family transporter [Terriglobales bacterium]